MGESRPECPGVVCGQPLMRRGRRNDGLQRRALPGYRLQGLSVRVLDYIGRQPDGRSQPVGRPLPALGPGMRALHSFARAVFRAEGHGLCSTSSTFGWAKKEDRARQASVQDQSRKTVIEAGVDEGFKEPRVQFRLAMFASSSASVLPKIPSRSGPIDSS